MTNLLFAYIILSLLVIFLSFFFLIKTVSDNKKLKRQLDELSVDIELDENDPTTILFASLKFRTEAFIKAYRGKNHKSGSVLAFGRYMQTLILIIKISNINDNIIKDYVPSYFSMKTTDDLDNAIRELMKNHEIILKKVKLGINSQKILKI